jgi:hypothetical protein
MSTVEVCHKCGVPLSVSGQFIWGDNGVIAVKGAQHDRHILYESRVIDNLFIGIEVLIGKSVQHMVIESRRREVRRFIEKAIGDIVEFFRSDGHPGGSEELAIAKETVLTIMDVGGSYGYGQSILGEGWDRGDAFPWRSNIIKNPYSLPFRIAEILGSIEALEGRDMAAEWQDLDEEAYRVNSYPKERSAGLKERLKRKRYEFKPGEIALEKCEVCGIPIGISHYKWSLAEGIIVDPDNGRRMAIYPPAALEAVLLDLETELGEMIPDLAVQAQKEYVKSRVGGDNWRHGRVTFGQLVALRGLGNLTKFEADEKHLALKIENSCLQPIMVGMGQALFELALNIDKTSYEWELSKDGDLEMLIKA